MNKKIPDSLYWENGTLFLLNQNELPNKVVYKKCKAYTDVIDAVKNKVIAGAAAVSVAVAYGVVLAGIKCAKYPPMTKSSFIKKACDELSRVWNVSIYPKKAIEKMMVVVDMAAKLNPENFISKLEETAKEIYEQDIEANIVMAEYATRLLKKESTVVTHANSGAFSSAGFGTAIGTIKNAFKNGKVKKVLVDETRPYFQGSRLTAYELQQEKIPYMIMADSMAAFIMKTEKIDAVIVGAEKVALNGDVANNIGTYALSIFAKYHKIPFYVIAHTSVIDFATTYGVKIKVDDLPGEDVLKVGGKMISVKEAVSRNPVLDVTPASNITMIITEKGVFKPNKISTLKKKK